MWSQQTGFPILTTKLIPPSQLTGLVDRHRLLARIERILQERLCLVTAPAGYGKTTVLAQAFALLAAQDRRVGWLSVERDDNDLARFLSYLIEAGRRTGLSFGGATAILLGARAGLPAQTLKTSLLNELAGLTSDFFLVLDDYHLLEDPETLDFLNSLLLAPLPHVHLLIGARSHDALPLGRLRALGQVNELEAADLVFSEAEISAFFSQVARISLANDSITSLRAGTEGWIASLQMIAIALRGSDDVSSLVRAFTGEHRSISDFLSEEVFERQPAEIQQFLLGTSMLKRFNCGLCNAVLRRKDSRELLDRLESANLFIFSLGSDRHWYRYHHLFSEFLRKVLADRSPEELAEYHRRACAWLAANDFTTEAIEHAFASGDLARAAALLDDASTALFATGQTSTLQMYSARLPPELLNGLPRLQLELAWNYEIQWRFDLARRVLENVRDVLSQRRADSLQGSQRRAIDFLFDKLAHRELMLAMFTDDYATALQLCLAWQRSNSSDDLFMEASVGTSLMMCNREHYSCEGTAQTAEYLRRLFVDASALYGTIFHDTASGETFYMRGDLDRAKELYERALATAQTLHGAGSELASMPAMLLAELLYERGATEAAAQLLDQYRATSAEFGFVDHAVARFTTEARVARARLDRSAMETALDAGSHIAARYQFKRLHAHLLLERVRHLIAGGNVKEAVRVTQAGEMQEWCRGWSPGPNASTTDELFATCHALVVAETGRGSEAIALMRKWFVFTRDRHCYRSAVRVGALLVKLCARAGDKQIATRYLLETLKLAAPGGFIRTLVDEGPVLAQLLRDLLQRPLESSGLSRGYVESLLEHFGGPLPEAKAVRTEPDPGLDTFESLSARELEILRLTAENLENKEIAGALGLTESTVKWYWKRIFSKLRVHRRFHAVKVARQNGLVA
ncbi:MAG: hypothetical protein JSR66_21350 [Proteobacteria bacterium]|nr:hypothetical protein [Pseudomonadota bacterium]